jgi:hypothetical protein
MFRRYRRMERRVISAASAAIATALVLSGCSSGSHPSEGQNPYGLHSVGQGITVRVSPGTALSVSVPGVGRIIGAIGSFTHSGTITIEKEDASFSAASGLQTAGTGIGITFHGTALRRALTLVFDAGPRPAASAVPVIAHLSDNGIWNVQAAKRNAAGDFTFSTRAFSINIPSWANPLDWWNSLTSWIDSAVAGRTAPLDCSGAPSWFHLDDTHSDLVHVCAKTNYTSDGTQVAEVQIKSNRGVSLEVTVPGSPSYVWVQGEPWAWRQTVASALGFDPNQTVILPPGATMTVGYPRGSISAPWSFFVTGVTWKAVADTVIRDLVDFGAGRSDPTLVGYSEVKCATGLGLGPAGISIGVNSLRTFLTCWTGQVASDLMNQQNALQVASQFGSAEDASTLVEHAKAVSALGWLVTLWPVFQLGIGNDIDKINELLSNGQSALVTYHMDPRQGQTGPVSNTPSTSQSGSGGSSSPTTTPSSSNPPTPTPVNAYDNYGPANAGHAMCRGNPGRPESMPGGSASQTFTVPPGVASLSGALIQIDPDPTVTAYLTVYMNGTAEATANAAAAGDTQFSFGPISVQAGDSVTIAVTFAATYGKIITVYTAGDPGGTFTASNSCSDGAPSLSTTSTGLRAVVSGMS